MKIIVDGMGGDHAPAEIVKGIVAALGADKELSVIVTGEEGALKSCLAQEKYDASRLEIVNCTQVVTNDESPTAAIRQKPDSSLVVALKMLKENEEIAGLVSAGSTGAVLAGGLLKVGRIKGISRPAVCPALPTIKEGKKVLLLDGGANAECKALNLCHFAVMGACYSKVYFGVENPKVALLSNGTEDHKGDTLRQETFRMLKEMSCIDFVGNIEGRDIMSGEYDVVVADGFSGNVALKSLECAVMGVLSLLKREVKKSLRAKIGYLFMKPAFRTLKKTVDFNKQGGAVLLGIQKVIVKSHGASKAESIAASILQAKSAAAHGLNQNISDMLAKIDLSALETGNQA